MREIIKFGYWKKIKMKLETFKYFNNLVYVRQLVFNKLNHMENWKIEINRKAWGTLIVLKNSENKNKRYDKQKSIPINNSIQHFTLQEMNDIFRLVIEITKKLKYEEIKNKLMEIKNE